MQRETILWLYTKEKNTKAQNYEMFNYLIKHYEALCTIYISCGENKSGYIDGVPLSALEFIKDADVHLSYYTCTRKHLVLLKKVFKLSSQGKTVRAISKELGISLTQVVRCHFIVVNYLAHMYSACTSISA